MGGFFSGAVRWLFGRFGASAAAPPGPGVCAALSVAPQVNATLSLALEQVDAALSVAPQVSATLTIEPC